MRLQDQLKAISSSPVRNDLDRRIRDLNQKNLTAQIQLDQERSRVEDLRKQLADARDIKQEIVERGQSANLKVDLLNDELSQARGRIQTLENALVSAREAIRILQNGGRGSSSIQFRVLQGPWPPLLNTEFSWNRDASESLFNIAGQSF